MLVCLLNYVVRQRFVYKRLIKLMTKKKQLADNYFIKIGQSCLAQIQCLLCYTIFNTYIPGKIDRHIQNCYEFLPIDQQKDLKIIEELENNHFIRD